MIDKLSYYSQILPIVWGKYFSMSDFVRQSLEEVEALVDERIRLLPEKTKMGIFGIVDCANVIHRRLLKKNISNVKFLASNPVWTEFSGKPLVDVNGPVLSEFDAVFASSLSHAEVQVDVLRKNGFGKQILTFPNLSHISTSLKADNSTVRTLRRLEAIQSDKPAFIIGNGPSLNETDPRRIPREFTRFAANGIVHLEKFCPDYFFALDVMAIRMWPDEIRNLKARRVYPSNLAEYVKSTSGLSRRNDIYFPMCYKQQNQLNVFKWFSRGFESGHSVVCPMIQFALLMGCNPIFLIGVDVSYGSSGNYFSNQYHPKGTPGYKEEDIGRINRNIKRGIERSVMACQEAGVRIYNCSPRRNLPFMDDFDFNLAIQKKF